MPRASIRPHVLALLITGALLSACGERGDSTAAQTGASDPTGAASENTAAAGRYDNSGNDNSDGGNGTPTGLAPAPWAMSAPQPASDGLRPPVIHTVD
ncbi:hypothetical protein [Paraburkholderia sp. SOS3]|uniref:hypothetical protein n=1 Tax=Paraburkholderia sp. SOS3 TaxID=1926494 RepID=UPI0009473973|nr:hypothetical protein [Paraburkholderia sp. SOS3]APR39597.1 hypothetical protein BTO02_30700 [Paraburkholderia sp. SOS3]